jgi:cation:H+ antiporter
MMSGLPEIALGDIIGGNLADMTLVLAIAAFFTRRGIPANSEVVQKSAVFTSVIAVLPLLLMWDARLSRIDGVILLLAFFCYAWWIFSEKSRFTKEYNGKTDREIPGFKKFIGALLKIIVLLVLLLAASQAVIISAQFFSASLNISLALTSILIVGLGNVFPEAYFSIISARRKENWMILGELMGSIIICATLVLGLLAVIYPFEIRDFSAFMTARLFLIIAAILSLFFIKTDKKITKKEGLLLLLIYIIFLLVEVFMQ